MSTALTDPRWQKRLPSKEGEPEGWRSIPSWESTGGAKLEPNYFCRARNGKRKKYCAWRAGAQTDHVGLGTCSAHGGNNRVTHGRYRAIQRPRIAELIAHFESDENPLETLPEITVVRALLVDWIERYDDITESVLAWHASYAPAMRPLHPKMVEALQVVLDELEALAGPFEEPEVRVEPEPQQHGGWLKRTRLDDADDGTGAVATAVSRARLLLEALRTPPDLKPRQMMDIADGHHLAESATRMVERIQKARSALHISRRDFFRVMGEMGRQVELSNGITDPDERLASIRDGWKTIRLA